MTLRPRIRPGTTLLELCVTLAIIAIATSVVTLAARHIDTPNPADFTLRIASAQRAALANARPVVLTILRHDSAFAVTVLPDGSVLADSALHLDRLTGRLHAP